MIINDRITFHILVVLREKDVNEILKAMTLDEIEEVLIEWLDKEKYSNKVSLRMISTRVKQLTNLKFIEKGLKSGSMNSYFITDSGIQFVKENHFDKLSEIEECDYSDFWII